MKQKRGIEMKCKICGAPAVIATPIGYAYCESCITELYGLRKSSYCAHCGKILRQDVIAKGDVFCSIECVANHWWGTKLNIVDNRMKSESPDYRFDLDY